MLHEDHTVIILGFHVPTSLTWHVRSCRKLWSRDRGSLQCYNSEPGIEQPGCNQMIMGVLQQLQLRGFVLFIEHHHKFEQLLNDGHYTRTIYNLLGNILDDVRIAKYNDVTRKLCLTSDIQKHSYNKSYVQDYIYSLLFLLRFSLILYIKKN